MQRRTALASQVVAAAAPERFDGEEDLLRLRRRHAIEPPGERERLRPVSDTPLNLPTAPYV